MDTNTNADRPTGQTPRTIHHPELVPYLIYGHGGELIDLTFGPTAARKKASAYARDCATARLHAARQRDQRAGRPLMESTDACARIQRDGGPTVANIIGTARAMAGCVVTTSKTYEVHP